MSDVIVVTREAVDLGAGPHHRVRFHDATYHIDDEQQLHIRRDTSAFPEGGNIGAFARGEWVTVIGGAIVEVDQTEDEPKVTALQVVPFAKQARR